MNFAVFWVCVCPYRRNDDEEIIFGPSLFNIGLSPRAGDIPILNRKIYRGYRVSIQEHPYIVSIRRNYAHYVVGVIITQNLIITVAHPLDDVPINELGVVVGENYADRGTALLTVVLVIVHSKFDPYTLDGDIALLRLYENIHFKTSVKPIKGICEKSFNHLYKKVFVTGWGRCDLTGKELCLPRSSRYYPDEKLDPMLRTIEFSIQEPSQCEMYKRMFDANIGTGMLCAGIARADDPVTPCMAVPGAPMVVYAHLLGFQSWGFACGFKYDLPVIYTDIRKYQSWLHHNVHILSYINRDNLTNLFQATKSYVMSRWLNQTREIKTFHEHIDDEIQPLQLDRMLAPLKGSVYDIRNYVGDGKFNEAKLKMYELIRLALDRREKIAKVNNELSDLNPQAFTRYLSDFDDSNDEKSDIDTSNQRISGRERVGGLNISYNKDETADSEGVYEYEEYKSTPDND